MLRVIFCTLILFGLSADLSAQRFRDARTYYREFAGENRRIMMKNMRYLEGMVKGEDPRRIAKYREMVIEQLNETKRNLNNVGAFKDDDVLQREYLKAIDMYLEAFTETANKAKELTADRYENFEKLTLYYNTIEEAEALIFDAAYKIEEAESFFAKQYNVDLRRDEKTATKWNKLDQLTVYMRELSFNFFRVDTRLSAFLTAAKGENKDTLSDLVDEVRMAVRKSKEALEDMPEFDGKSYAADELSNYLTDSQEAIEKTFKPLADQLANNFLDEDDYEDAQRELEYLKEWHLKARTDFFEEQAYVVEKYLEE